MGSSADTDVDMGTPERFNLINMLQAISNKKGVMIEDHDGVPIARIKTSKLDKDGEYFKATKLQRLLKAEFPEEKIVCSGQYVLCPSAILDSLVPTQDFTSLDDKAAKSLNDLLKSKPESPEYELKLIFDELIELNAISQKDGKYYLQLQEGDTSASVKALMLQANSSLTNEIKEESKQVLSISRTALEALNLTEVEIPKNLPSYEAPQNIVSSHSKSQASQTNRWR